jgi:hypothetical protein
MTSDSYVLPELARQRSSETAHRARLHRPWREPPRETRSRSADG